jgi:uncharacterized SAM-binding protein YcdF (DUF218 family)
MSTYVLLKFLGNLAMPPSSLLVGLVIAGVVALFGFRRFGKFIAVLTVGEFLLLSVAPVANALMAPLQDEARAEAKAAPPCCYDAIVVLGGSISAAAPPRYPEPALVGSSDRLWQAARMYHRGLAPRIIVTGGTYGTEGTTPSSESAAMRLFLHNLGVPDEAIIEEGRALNTLENIAFVREIVQGKQVALVTSAYHMPRAMRTARQARLNAAAFPSEWRYAGGDVPWENYLPSMNAISISSLALWEYLALVFDRRKGPSGP